MTTRWSSRFQMFVSANTWVFKSHISYCESIVKHSLWIFSFYTTCFLWMSHHSQPSEFRCVSVKKTMIFFNFQLKSSPAALDADLQLLLVLQGELLYGRWGCWSLQELQTGPRFWHLGSRRRERPASADQYFITKREKREHRCKSWENICRHRLADWPDWTTGWTSGWRPGTQKRNIGGAFPQFVNSKYPKVYLKVIYLHPFLL